MQIARSKSIAVTNPLLRPLPLTSSERPPRQGLFPEREGAAYRIVLGCSFVAPRPRPERREPGR